jgi:nucleoside-triphosphatase THEP1
MKYKLNAQIEALKVEREPDEIGGFLEQEVSLGMFFAKVDEVFKSGKKYIVVITRKNPLITDKIKLVWKNEVYNVVLQEDPIIFFTKTVAVRAQEIIYH